MYGDLVRTGLIAMGHDLYALGDDGALYAFSAHGADALKPEIGQALLQIQVEAAPYAFQLRAFSADAMVPAPAKEDILQIPGVPPVYLQLAIYDAGCGLNPDTLQMQLDGKAVPDDEVVYQADQGLLWWLYEPQGVMATSLPNGMHRMDVAATDWRGNKDVLRVYFYVDNGLTVPVVPAQEDTTQGGPGGPGMPGGPGGAPQPQG